VNRPDGPAAVAVAVVSWNTRELLDRCLASLAHDAHSGLAEVWVVDNSSRDGSADAARRRPFARVVALEENLGFAPALDLVARATESSWVACANADVALTPGALERLLAAGEARPSVGAVAPRLVLPDGTTQLSVHSFPTARRHALYNSGLARFAPGLGERLAFGGFWDPGRGRYVGWALGTFLVIRREALEQVGGFGSDTRLYGEDLDLGWRLAGAGWRTWYEPTAVVRHDGSAATSKAWGEARHALRMAAGYGWMVGRRGAAPAAATAAVNIAGAMVRGLLAFARQPRGTRWKSELVEAWRHAVGLWRGLGDRRWRDL
jgi:N-acetylglucosaminyl-diphospho-decaprenol L-rhamnosyltransferase